MPKIALVVEEVLPTDKITAVNLRVQRYLTNGTRVVCLLHPEEQAMTVYRAGSGCVFYEPTDVVPEFRCGVAEFITALRNQS